MEQDVDLALSEQALNTWVVVGDAGGSLQQVQFPSVLCVKFGHSFGGRHMIEIMRQHPAFIDERPLL